MYKYLLGLLIIVFSGSLIAFQTKEEDQVFETVRFQYDLDEENGIDNPGNWVDVTDISPDDCGTSGDLPCVVEFSTTQYTPQGNDRGIASFLDTYDDALSIMNSGHLEDSKADQGK